MGHAAVPMGLAVATGTIATLRFLKSVAAINGMIRNGRKIMIIHMGNPSPAGLSVIVSPTLVLLLGSSPNICASGSHITEIFH